MTDKIIAAARAAGGTTYTNRHHNGTACAFGPEALARFYAIARAEALEDAANILQANAQLCSPHSIFQLYLSSNADAIRALKEQQHG